MTERPSTCLICGEQIIGEDDEDEASWVDAGEQSLKERDILLAVHRECYLALPVEERDALLDRELRRRT